MAPALEVEGQAEIGAPWEEAAIAILRGGRSTAATGRLYGHAFSRRLLLQAGARSRRLSILASDSLAALRATAAQSLWLAGADFVLWRSGASVQGEMFDDALVAPMTLGSAVTLACRHYDVSTRTTPAFNSLIAIAPRGSVDEASIITTLAPLHGRLGLDLQAGIARDVARTARTWMARGALTCAPMRALRFTLGYEHAAEVATGLVGRRRSAWLSTHVDL